MFTLLIYSAAGGDVKQSEFRRWLESGRRCGEWQQPFETQVSRRRSVMPRHPCDEIKEPLRSNPETTRFELIAN